MTKLVPCVCCGNRAAAYLTSILPTVVGKVVGLHWKHFPSFPTADDWTSFPDATKDEFLGFVSLRSNMNTLKVLRGLLDNAAGS